jgi:hypothetical protein
MQKLIRVTLILIAAAVALDMTLPAGLLARTTPDAGVQSPKPADAQSRYLGVQTCANCHAEIAERQQKSFMAQAQEKIGDCKILRAHPNLKFQQGKFTYRITRQGDKSIYTISDGTSEVSAPILYCFGQGRGGQTYVFEYNGAFCESRVSFYTEIKGLDITLGYALEVPQTLTEAAGRQMSVDETNRCFGCHTTGAPGSSQTRPEQLAHRTSGISCEACHGPGDQHVAFLKAGDPATAKAKIKGFRNLDGDDIAQNLCGSCHRSVEDVMALPNRGGINNVRFQPYRMFNSRCYSADKRIGCTACHDPHGQLQQSEAFYDAKCLACHQVKQEGKSEIKQEAQAAKPGTGEARGARACKIGKSNCASCHMPKIDLPGSHFKFTDHRIRIVREGAPFPN